MKHLKRSACLLTFFLLFGAASAQAAEHVPSEWAKKAVNEANALGLVPDRLRSNYQAPITREEFAELIVQTIFAKLEHEAESKSETVYWTPEKVLRKIDVDIAFEDAKQEHVKLAFILGSVNGVSETAFAPDRRITRQEAATMLMNTSHLADDVIYRTKEQLRYADFDKIADWAKPAVQASASSGLMEGAGGRFDYAGKFTREQSIATMLRLYRSPYAFAIRGNLEANPAYEELRYNVGSNYVQVVYHRGHGAPSALASSMYEQWHRHPSTAEAKDQFSMEKAIALFAFRNQLKPNDYPELIEQTILGRGSKWDYGWMKLSVFNRNSVLRFEFAPSKGYMINFPAYSHGYPPVPVKVKRIEE
ncbi:S-layer homology domain-containing protein [Paenibacillaceae bacterium WGS1546]|uniref:S-layer homology domain-containing protein n=1 Tax=Cohnella sp. WGS1546 TaxID=3366810 RepID=UPI00372D1D6A